MQAGIQYWQKLSMHTYSSTEVLTLTLHCALKFQTEILFSLLYCSYLTALATRYIQVDDFTHGITWQSFITQQNFEFKAVAFRLFWLLFGQCSDVGNSSAKRCFSPLNSSHCFISNTFQMSQYLLKSQRFFFSRRTFNSDALFHHCCISNLPVL